MKLAINLFLSLAMLALCLWLVWPTPHDQELVGAAFRRLTFANFGPYVAGYVLLLALTHFLRAWRCNSLYRPIGAELPPGKLLAIQSVGFMAILALPARLGEFVRPALMRDRGKVSASAVLGTVAVERIVDGLMVSLLVFGACFALRGWHSPWWAYLSLGVFFAAMTFLAFALKWPERTIKICVAMTLLPLVAPRIAKKIEELLAHLIRGFRVLGDKKNLFWFVFWSIAYWVTNGMGMYVLARGMGLPLSVMGAFATMGVIAVGITLPNSPGLVGQFQAAAVAGLALYMPTEIAHSVGLAYAILLHAIQFVWYIGIGVIAMNTGHVSFGEIFHSQRTVNSEGQAESV